MCRGATQESKKTGKGRNTDPGRGVAYPEYLDQDNSVRFREVDSVLWGDNTGDAVDDVHRLDLFEVAHCRADGIL